MRDDKIGLLRQKLRYAEHQHRRPPCPEGFLNTLAERLADAAVLPLAVARQAVRAVAISAREPIEPADE